MTKKTNYRRLAEERFINESDEAFNVRMRNRSAHRCDEQSMMEADMGETWSNDKRFRSAHRWHEMLSLQEDAMLSEVDNSEVVNLITTDQFETDPKEFNRSLRSGSRSEMLTDYSTEDLSSMKTFKVKGQNAGFAVKSDGDIVSVHNNTDVKGLGPHLIKAAIRHGGKKLDHYDGYLTGFYRKLGFKITNVVEWDDAYASQHWKYEKLEIDDPDKSVYAGEFTYGPKKGSAEWKAKKKQYASGRPDIIYRSL